MKIWQSISLLLLSVVVLFLSQTEVGQKMHNYADWKVQFGKQFSAEEQSYRKIIFSNTVKDIQSHNSNPLKTYTKGVNQFTHLSQPQFQEMFFNRFYKNQAAPTISQTEVSYMSEILQQIDWYALGKVSPVRDQGNCDAGYAFCSASLIESFYLFQNQIYTLSEQQILDCSASYTTFGCQGGSRNGTLTYIREKGLNADASYPYKAVKGTCQKQTGDYKPSYTHVQFNGCDNIKNALYNGPLTVAVNALQWRTYKTGIFYGCTSTQVNHDVNLIGIGTNFWKIKNSWGLRWGEYGYIRLALGNTCGVCEKPAFGFK